MGTHEVQSRRAVRAEEDSNPYQRMEPLARQLPVGHGQLTPSRPTLRRSRHLGSSQCKATTPTGHGDPRAFGLRRGSPLVMRWARLLPDPRPAHHLAR